MAASAKPTTLNDVLVGLRSDGRLLPIEDVVYLVKEISANLERNNGFNGDLSPLNILLSNHSEISLVAADSPDKVRYMSPERVNGTAPNIGSNVFSLGLIFWRMLFGRGIYADGSPAEVVEKIRKFKLPNLPATRQVPDEVKWILEKMLIADPADRSSARAVNVELGAFLMLNKPGYQAHIVVGPKPVIKPPQVREVQDYRPSHRQQVQFEIIDNGPPDLVWKRWVLLALLICGGLAYRYQDVYKVKGLPGMAIAIKNDLQHGTEAVQVAMAKWTNDRSLAPKSTHTVEAADSVEQVATSTGTEQAAAATPVNDNRNSRVGEVNLNFNRLETMTMKLQTIPSGASVLINSEVTNLITPVQIAVKENQTVKVTFKREGFKPCPALVSTKVGTFTCRLEPLKPANRPNRQVKSAQR